MPAQKKTASSLLTALIGTLGFSALAGLLVTVMIAPALAVTGMTANNTIGIFESLPEYLVIDNQHQQNEILAKNADGSDFHIATVYDQNREEVSLDEMSDWLKVAAVAGEDRRYYDHGGIDVPSVVRAAIGNATGTSGSGASTITMQLVRNIRVQEAFNETGVDEKQRAKDVQAAVYPDLGRKLQEMKYAIGLEKKYSKQAILAAYLPAGRQGDGRPSREPHRDRAEPDQERSRPHRQLREQREATQRDSRVHVYRALHHRGAVPGRPRHQGR